MRGGGYRPTWILRFRVRYVESIQPDFRQVEASSDAVLQGFAAAEFERLALKTEGRLREREIGNGRFVSASRGVGPQQSPGASGHFA